MSSRKTAGERDRTRAPDRDETDALVDTYFDSAPTTDQHLYPLCRQVEEAVHLALSASADPRLHSLIVIGVEPVRGAARLRVSVSAFDDEEDENDINTDDIERALARARGYLRREVAAAIARKRVPELSLVYVPWQPGDDDDAW